MIGRTYRYSAHSLDDDTASVVPIAPAPRADTVSFSGIVSRQGGYHADIDNDTVGIGRDGSTPLDPSGMDENEAEVRVVRIDICAPQTPILPASTDLAVAFADFLIGPHGCRGRFIPSNFAPELPALTEEPTADTDMHNRALDIACSMLRHAILGARVRFFGRETTDIANRLEPRLDSRTVHFGPLARRFRQVRIILGLDG